MLSDSEMIIEFNPLSKFPYEVYLGHELIETFVFEKTAKEMIELNKQVHALYCRNEYEKFVLKKLD